VSKGIDRYDVILNTFEDGVHEVRDAHGKYITYDDFMDAMARIREGAVERAQVEIEKYCGDEDIGDGAGKTWNQWKADFAASIVDAVLGVKP